MANIPPKADATLAGTIVVSATRGSSASYTLNDSSLYQWWEDSYFGETGLSGGVEESPVSSVPELPLPPAESAPETVVVAAPAPTLPVPMPVAAPSAPREADLPLVVVSAAKPKPAPRPKPRPRRSKPAPKPSRRPRPTTRPGPRIPIQVPALVRVTLGRLAGVLALVPALFETLKAIDRDSQDKVYDRLFGSPGDDRERSRDPLADSARMHQPAPRDEPAPLPEVVVVAQRPLETVVVTGRAPSPLPAPAPLPFDLVSPRLDYGLEPLPISESIPSPAPRPSPSPKPVPVNAPLPFAPPAPEAVPQPSPSPRPTPRPAPAPSTPTRIPGPTLGPSIDPTAGPRPLEHRCTCRVVDPNKKPKKKKKKKEKPEYGELEVEYEQPGVGKVLVKGQAKKFCFIAPKTRKRICL